MAKQVVTIGYLKSFISGFGEVSLNTNKPDSYCPTYSELTNNSFITQYRSSDTPSSMVNGIRITSTFNGNNGYSTNQLVTRNSLELVYRSINDCTVYSNKNNISCCGDSASLSIYANFYVYIKGENGTNYGKTIGEYVSGTFSDNASYTTINGNSISFSKNSVSYPNNASSRTTTVTGSCSYIHGGGKASTVNITQNGNYIGEWINTSQKTNSLGIEPSGFNFSIYGGTISYKVKRYYTQYRVKRDSCGSEVASDSYNTSSYVTPSSSSSSNGVFTASTASVSVSKQKSGGASRSSTITVYYEGHNTTANATQPACVISDWTASGGAFDEVFSVDVSVDGAIKCEGGTAQASSLLQWKQKYIKTDCFGSTVDSKNENKSRNVTNETTWTTNRGTISKTGLLTYPKCDGSEATTTVTGKYNSHKSSDSIKQSGCEVYVFEFTNYHEYGDSNKTKIDFESSCSEKQCEWPLNVKSTLNGKEVPFTISDGDSQFTSEVNSNTKATVRFKQSSSCPTDIGYNGYFTLTQNGSNNKITFKVLKWGELHFYIFELKFTIPSENDPERNPTFEVPTSGLSKNFYIHSYKRNKGSSKTAILPIEVNSTNGLTFKKSNDDGLLGYNYTVEYGKNTGGARVGKFEVYQPDGCQSIVATFVQEGKKNANLTHINFYWNAGVNITHGYTSGEATDDDSGTSQSIDIDSQASPTYYIKIKANDITSDSNGHNKSAFMSIVLGASWNVTGDEDKYISWSIPSQSTGLTIMSDGKSTLNITKGSNTISSGNFTVSTTNATNNLVITFEII